jgi:hypothetical protein
MRTESWVGVVGWVVIAGGGRGKEYSNKSNDSTISGNTSSCCPLILL